MYVEDYCNSPMNSDYKLDCNANFKVIDENTRYVCISHLQSKGLVDNVYYEETPYIENGTQTKVLSPLRLLE